MSLFVLSLIPGIIIATLVSSFDSQLSTSYFGALVLLSTLLSMLLIRKIMRSIEEKRNILDFNGELTNPQTL